MNNDLHFSSATGKWDTPAHVVKDLATVFAWDWDVCADRANVCKRFYGEQDSALDHHWRGLCWMNPPYGRGIGAWMKKAARETEATIVCLVPARTDTAWWHNNIPFASLVVFIRGRLKFGGSPNAAPFPSGFLVFGETLTDDQRD